MRRLAFVVIVLLGAGLPGVLMPSPAFAHGAGGGGGGTNVPLLVAGGALAAAAGIALAAGRLKPSAGGGLLAAGVVLIVASFLGGGGGDDRPDVHLAIAEPQPAARVAAGTPITVRVAIDDGALATGPTDDGGHLHLYVDRKLQQMPYSTEVQVTLTPGRHTLTVEYVDSRHVSYRPPIEQTIEVTAG